MRISSSSLIPIRDDSSGPKSQSTNERDFIKSCALRAAAGSSGSSGNQSPRSSSSSSCRLDGRSANQIRSTRRISLVRWENGSSATVEWGSRVLCTCVGRVLPPPYVDRPNEGVVSISVDLSPSASMAYRNATPASTTSSGAGGGGGGGASGGSMDESQKLETNRILRALERVLLIGGCLDTEALVVNQQWVWQLSLHVTVLDNASSSTQGGGGGNLVDASLMACMAALRHYRQPHVQVDHGGGDGGNSSILPTAAPPILIPSHEKEPTPLPLHHTPLSLTFALIQSSESGMSTNSGNTGTASASSSSRSSNTNHVAILLDPTHREELVAQNARLTIAMNIHKEICLLDFGGGCELQPSLLVEKCCQEAAKQIPLLCQSLEKSLEQADHQALQERLAQLQQQLQQRSTSSGGAGDGDQLPPLPPSSSSLLPPFLAGVNDDNAAADNDDRDEMEGIAYYQTQDPTTVAPSDEASAQTAAAALDAQKQAEEAYRRLALDYNIGHVASKVAENDDKDSNKQGKNSNNSNNKNTMATTSTSRLLAAMLRSGQAAATTSAAEHDYANAVVTTEPPSTTLAGKVPVAHPIQEEGQKVKGKDMGKAIEQKKPPPTAAITILETSLKKPVTTKNALPKKVMVNDESDDEEETTMQLESEFQAVPLPAVPVKQKNEKAAPAPPIRDAVMADDSNDNKKSDQDGDDDNDDADDLAAAIIKKKKSKKKKSKK